MPPSSLGGSTRTRYLVELSRGADPLLLVAASSGFRCRKCRYVPGMVDLDGVLGALHATARLLRNTSLSIDALLSQVCALLPPAMQFPEDAAARIRFGAIEQASPGFAEVRACLARELEPPGGRGTIEVGYRAPHPDAQEGPFFFGL